VSDCSFDIQFDDAMGLRGSRAVPAISARRAITWQPPTERMPAFAVTPSAMLHSGFNNALICKVTRETHECRSYEFNFPSASSSSFTPVPGQFVPLRVKIDGEAHQRYYAISSLVAQGEPARITIKRKRGGLVSNWCHDELRPGMTVSIGRPTGAFGLRPGVQPALFMAAGIGIAPLFPMLKQAALTSRHPIRIAIFDRDEQAAVFLGSLRHLAKQYAERVHLAEIYTGCGPADPEDLRRQFEALPGAVAYVCGPAGFLECTQAIGAAAGIAPEQILINARDEADVMQRAQADDKLTRWR
jgi:ferredoxin-NADP reductase